MDRQAYKNINEAGRKQLEAMKELIAEELPSPSFGTWEKINFKIPMEDGVLLDAGLTCPDPQEAWPVILIRNPYASNDLLYSEVYAPIFAGFGYAVLIVSVRGALMSEGEWLPFENEKEDGVAVLNWIGEQPWCNGNVGTFGGSYLGHVQLTLSGLQHPLLKTMFVSVYGNLGYETFYHRGMFREEIFTLWAAQMMGDNRFKLIPPDENITLSVYPRKDLEKVLQKEPCSWYQTWIHNPESASDYWQKGYWGEMASCIEKLSVPIFLCGGWFDIFLRSQIDTWERMPKDIRSKSRYMIGPWHHGEAVGGTLSYPGEKRAGTGLLKAAIGWFDCMLKGRSYEEPVGGIDVYSIRENGWRHYDADFLERGTNGQMILTFHLGAGKNTKKENVLCEERTQEEAIDFTYDPAHPVKSRGGQLLSNHEDPSLPPQCSIEQEEIGQRDDVVSFVSKALKDDFRIEGSMKVHLFVSSSAQATAFTVKISEVFADGRTFNIRDDITDIRWQEKALGTYKPGGIQELIFDLPHIVWKLAKGSRVRLDVSSSNFPAFHVHPNTTTPWADALPREKAQQTLYVGGSLDARLEIPGQEI